jgi:hypothetical protein
MKHEMHKLYVCVCVCVYEEQGYLTHYRDRLQTERRGVRFSADARDFLYTLECSGVYQGLFRWG